MTKAPPDSAALPADVVAAIHRGNKVEAIKRLREAHAIGLKDAKELVDEWVRADPALVRKYERQASAAARVFWFALFALILATVGWKLYG